MPALEADALTHRYGTHLALDQVTFAVPEGALFGLLGPNGGGKSTLFRLAATLLPPASGALRVFGRDVVTQAADVRRQLGVIFQHVALDRELTVRENLRVHGALVGMRGRALDARIDTLLAEFGLADRAPHRVKALSGGLARRVDLARGLLHRPRLLLLDEPTTGLDPLARRDLWETLARLQQSEGTTVVVATHLMEEAARCDALAILHHGHIVAEGTPDALCARLGEQTLWLESPDPDALHRDLETVLGLHPRVVGRHVLVEHPEPAPLLGRLYERFGAVLLSATIRRPTLEDVFIAATGNTLRDVEAEVT